MSKRRNAGWSKRNDNYKDKPAKGGCAIGEDGKLVVKCLDENSEILRSFRKYAAQLDDVNDKFERIVKIGRDVTIESKRIIFLLHSSDRVNSKSTVLEEAEKRLKCLIADNFLRIAKELKDEDPYLFHKAYTFGMQEFIEAYTFYHYLKDKKMYHWSLYQDFMRYKIPRTVKASSNSETDDAECESAVDAMTTLPPLDFILGIADLSGELMRRCINNLGVGDLDGCFETCNIVRKLYAGFLSLNTHECKEMSHKMFTLKQSLLKMENVCYNIHVRSKELPEHMLADFTTEFEYPNKDDYLS